MKKYGISSKHNLLSSNEENIDYGQLLLIHCAKISEVTARPVEIPNNMPHNVTIERIDEIGEKNRLASFRHIVNVFEAFLTPSIDKLKIDKKGSGEKEYNKLKECNDEILKCDKNDFVKYEGLLMQKLGLLMMFIRLSGFIMNESIEETIGRYDKDITFDVREGNNEENTEIEDLES